MNNPDPLNQLRIDRSAAPAPRNTGGRWPLVLGAAVVLLVAAGAWWGLREDALPVKTATAPALNAASGVRPRAGTSVRGRPGR